ncbi:hypothetical protein [Pseudorhodobacter aquimaris]|uniref:hypothetical protein n=1 Tax=Pseudorhodobacter aquimaris TaxID=687412 RepID=UPI0012ED8809|nr:hypothetical protein [Pseudorhodobacter aquimaris]
MTHDTYTKAATLACLKWIIPRGKLALIGEKEGQMARVVPHICREEILADSFERAVIGFNKNALIDRIPQNQAEFSKSLTSWRDMHPHLTPWEALQSWTSANLKPIDHTNQTTSREARGWVHCPIQPTSIFMNAIRASVTSSAQMAVALAWASRTSTASPKIRAS